MQEAAGNVREVENILCVRRCRGLFLGWLTRKVLFGHCSLGKSMQNIGKEVADWGEASRTVSKGGFLGCWNEEGGIGTASSALPQLCHAGKLQLGWE